jgi:Tol biopolymer transport system component
MLAAAALVSATGGCGKGERTIGVIAYSPETEVDSEGDPVGSASVFTIRSDGSHRTRLVSDAAAPTWSPDGSRLAFVDEGGGVNVTRADGTGRHGIARHLHGFCWRPTWGPDSRQLACVTEWGGGESESHTAVVTIDLRTGHVREFLKDRADADASLAWSPDGRTLAIDRGPAGGLDPWGEKTGIDLLDLERGETRRLLTVGWTPAWSADGERIAFGTADGIATIKRDGTYRRMVVESASRLASPSWSPDGKQLAYDARGGFPEDRGVFVIDIDGTDRRSLDHRGLDPDWRSD